MAIKRVRPKNECYGTIDRGASLTIPVKIMDPEENPIDLTEAHIAFTIKRVPFDFDMADDRAYVQKDFDPQDPLNGKFYIQLSSKEMDFEPGQFHFDIEIYKDDGMVFRIVNLEFTLVGGPTNRTVNDGVGQLPVGDEITIITIKQGRPIIVIAPIAASDSMTTQLTQIWSALADIQNDISTMKDDIDNLKVSVDNNTTDLQDIKPRLSGAEADILDLDNRVTALGG